MCLAAVYAFSGPGLPDDVIPFVTGLIVSKRDRYDP